MTASGYGAVDRIARVGDTSTGTQAFTGSPPIRVPTATAGQVLVSDSSGNMTPASGGNAFERMYMPTTYGADPTGVADSTTAFTNCISAVLNFNATPASTTRTPLATMFIPAGNYKITSDILIQSVSGFRLRGAGVGITNLIAHGTGFTNAVLFVDGSADGVFEGFAIQGDGTEQVNNGIRLDWTTNAARSTTANMFRDIRIRALKCIIGFSLEGNGSRQVDGTVMQNIVITGSQTPGSWLNTGNWQAGFALGDGVFANNYDHVMTGCGAALFYYGWKINVSSMDLDGSQPAGNFCDFWVLTNGQTSIKNVQSQNSGQLLDSPSQFAPSPTTVEDVLFGTNNPNAGFPIAKLNGGMWQFRNISATSIFASSAFQTGVFTIAGTSSTRQCYASFDNICVNGAKTSVFSNSNACVVVRNYMNYNPNTGLYAATTGGDELSSWRAGTWSNLDFQGGTIVFPPSSATAVSVATSGTVATAGLSVQRLTTAGAVTGVILAVGTVDGQVINLFNESANSITFAASGTSHIAGASALVIGASGAARLIWSSNTSLWYHFT